MEAATQYFCQELKSANDNLIKLSVVSALYSFLKKNNCKCIPINNELIKCFLGILTDQAQFNLSDFYDENNQITNGLFGKIFCDTADIKEKTTSIRMVAKHLKMMTLNCIYELSKHKLFFEKIDTQLQKCLMICLSTFCDSEKGRFNWSYFRFSCNFTKCIEKYFHLRDGNLKVNLVIEKNDTLSSLEFLTQYLKVYELKTAEHIQDIWCKQSRLFCFTAVDNPSPETGLLSLLKGQQVAWGTGYEIKHTVKEGRTTKKSSMENKDNNSKSKEKASDIHVTKVLNGNLLWVNVGEVSIKNAERIHSTLKQYSGTLHHYSGCKKNDIVAAAIFEHLSSETPLARCKILQITSSHAVVFALDIGDIYQVPLSSVFHLPPELSLIVLPQQVELAYFQDAIPTPVNLTCVEIALAAMTCLCRYPEAAKMFKDMKLLSLFPVLISCDNRTIALHALQLATNVTKYNFIDCSEELCRILLVTLELLNQIVRKYVEQEESINNSSPTTTCQTQVASVQRKSRDIESSPSKTLNTPNKSPNRSSTNDVVKDEDLIVSSSKLLANLIYKNQAMKDVFYRQSGLETVLICLRVQGKKYKVRSHIMQLLFNFVHTSYSNRETPYVGRSTNTATVLAEGRCGTDNNSDEDVDDIEDEDYRNDSSVEDDQDLKELSDDRGQEIGFDDHKEKGPTSHFIKGRKYPFFDDPRHELLEGLNLSSQAMALIVCGMLNSGQEGTICVGIGKEGEVKGEKVTHTKRDELRLGLDDIMARLNPHIMHFQLQVRFIPVVDPKPATENDGNSDEEMFVIEILCKPIPGVIHTLKPDRCYYRSGRRTVVVNEQDIRHLIVLDAEANYMEEIFTLQRKLDSLTSDNV